MYPYGFQPHIKQAAFCLVVWFGILSSVATLCERYMYFDHHLKSCHPCTDCGPGRTEMNFCTDQCSNKRTCEYGRYYDSNTASCHSCQECISSPSEFCEMCTEEEKSAKVWPPSTAHLISSDKPVISESNTTSEGHVNVLLVAVTTAGSIILVALILVIVIVFVYLPRRRRQLERQRVGHPTQEETLMLDGDAAINGHVHLHNHFSDSSPLDTERPRAVCGNNTARDESSGALVHLAEDLTGDFDPNPVRVPPTGNVSLNGNPVCHPQQDDVGVFAPSAAAAGRTESHVSLNSCKDCQMDGEMQSLRSTASNAVLATRDFSTVGFATNVKELES